MAGGMSCAGFNALNRIKIEPQKSEYSEIYFNCSTYRPEHRHRVGSPRRRVSMIVTLLRSFA